MTDSSAFTPAQAADPGTSAQDMAQIAAERPDLWPSLAANPSLYPDLRQWLRQVGGPDVQAALTASEQQTASVYAAQLENRQTGEAALPPPLVGGGSGAMPLSVPSVPSVPSAAYSAAPLSAPSVPSAAYSAAPPWAPSAAYNGAAPLAPVPPTGPKSSNTAAAVGIVVFFSVIVLAIGSVVLATYSRQSSDSGTSTLQTSCRSGDMADCDSLYYAARSGSSEESFGRSCGGRDHSMTHGGDCRSTYGSRYSSPSPTPYSTYNSSNSGLRDSCSKGDMGDCDSLYYLSPSGSSEESFGKSCGGRDYSMSYGGSCKSTYGSRY
ncbi:variant leucine-rich repeat-containing protein [Actinomyces israelii]|uniref:variant leucine-rich repeat-containing protein n=1 Tax=Actinomyces israelii TaxID=1659 RepID=UPI0005B955C7|nr:hypothetical protein [Actinomyces israelii]